jgi:hypothetical protein
MVLEVSNLWPEVAKKAQPRDYPGKFPIARIRPEGTTRSARFPLRACKPDSPVHFQPLQGELVYLRVPRVETLR